MRYQQIIDLCNSIESERSSDKLLLLIAELRQILSSERARIEKVLTRNTPPHLVVDGQEGTCSVCGNVYFYVRDARFWDQNASEALTLMQRQFDIHLSTIHELKSHIPAS